MLGFIHSHGIDSLPEWTSFFILFQIAGGSIVVSIRPQSMVGPIERQASLQRRRYVWGLFLEGRYMDVSEKRGTPKSSILIGFSIINHSFWGTPILETPICTVDDEMDYLLWFEEAPMLPSYRLDMFFMCSMFFLIWRWKRSCRDSGSLIFLHPRDSVHLHFQSLHNPIYVFFSTKKPEYSTDKIRYQLWASLLIHHFCWTRGCNFLTTHRPTLRMLGCFACKKSKKSTKVVTCQGKDPLVVKDRCW